MQTHPFRFCIAIVATAFIGCAETPTAPSVPDAPRPFASTIGDPPFDAETGLPAITGCVEQLEPDAHPSHCEWARRYDAVSRVQITGLRWNSEEIHTLTLEGVEYLGHCEGGALMPVIEMDVLRIEDYLGNTPEEFTARVPIDTWRRWDPLPNIPEGEAIDWIAIEPGMEAPLIGHEVIVPLSHVDSAGVWVADDRVIGIAGGDETRLQECSYGCCNAYPSEIAGGVVQEMHVLGECEARSPQAELEFRAFTEDAAPFWIYPRCILPVEDYGCDADLDCDAGTTCIDGECVVDELYP